jgi:serine protease Do
MRGWLSKVVLGAIALGGSAAQAQNLPPEYFEAIIKASVQFVCFDSAGKGQWQGSGSFIGREGIILTNNHVVADETNNQLCPVLRISMMKNEDQSPEPRYIGRVIARLPSVDLALVQVSTDLRGGLVPVGTRFPAVPLGDSNVVKIGERIFNFGFPDINGTSETITVSSGSVNGFLENRNLMKHDALSGPGGSGGGIYNLRGELIAVHSAGVSGNNNTRQPLGRPLVLGSQMIQQNVRGFGEPWTTQLGVGFNAPIVTPVNPNPTNVVQPPPLPVNPQPLPLPSTNNPVGAPNFPPKPNETWTVVLDGLAPWTLNFTALDQDGDPTGIAIQNGLRTEMWAYRMQNGNARFQMVATDGSGSYFCEFSKLQVNGNAFVAGVSLRSTRNPNGSGNITNSLNTSCVAALGSSVQLAGNQPIQPPTIPQALTASFPPKPNQTWTITIDGLAPWTINFTKLDSDGDPTGTATQNGVTKTAFAFTVQSGQRYFQVFDAQSVYYCVFPNAVQSSGSSLIGGRAFTAPTPDANAINMNKACVATITSDSSLQAPPTLPVVQLTAGLPPKPGQSWTMTIDGLAPWALNFTKLDSDGDPTGTGTQNGVTKPVYAYKLQSGGFRFQVFDARNTIYVCDFPKNTAMSGSSINGGSAGTAPNPDTNIAPLGKSCSVIINSVALFSKALGDPMLRASVPLDLLFKF